MIRKFSAVLAALAFALTTLAPVTAADARDRRGYYDRGYHGGHYDRRHRHRGHDRGDAVAAGAVGLILGLAVGSMLAQPREPRVVCRDNYRRCPPPRGGYYDDGYQRQGGYDPRYDDGGYSAYEQEYGLEGGPYEQGSYDPYVEQRRPQCTRRERQWDRYANRYLMVDVPC